MTARRSALRHRISEDHELPDAVARWFAGEDDSPPWQALLQPDLERMPEWWALYKVEHPKSKRPHAPWLWGAGKPAAGSWDTSCRDWEARINGSRSLLPDLPLVEAEAARAVAIFDRLRLPDVVGTPLLRDAFGDWFRDLVRAVFGSYDPATAERHLREFFVLVPKKNAKTTGAAAIMLVAVLMSRRPRAEFLIVAPSHEIAALGFRQAVGMIQIDPLLRSRFHVQDHLKTCTVESTGVSLKIKTFDPQIVTGSKPAGVFLDELHITAELHDADRVIGQLRSGMVSQPEAFMIMISTQSERAPAGMFRAELMKARAVRDGRIQTPLLPLIYELPAGTDWRDPATWPLVTPNNGRSVSVERLLPDYHAVLEAGEGELRRWASQHLNVEIGLGLRSDHWAAGEFWEAATNPTLTLEALIARSEIIEAGIDGGGLDDLYAIGFLGREPSGRWLHWGCAWAHQRVLEIRKSEAQRFADFVHDGDLRLVRTIGEAIHEASEICEIVEASKKLDRVGVDQAGIGATLEGLAAVGLSGDRVVGIRQGWYLNAAIKSIEAKLSDGLFQHGGRKLMAWNIANCKIELRGNATLITKQVSGSAKIDAAIALLNAAALLAQNPKFERPPEPSFFIL